MFECKRKRWNMFRNVCRDNRLDTVYDGDDDDDDGDDDAGGGGWWWWQRWGSTTLERPRCRPLRVLRDEADADDDDDDEMMMKWWWWNDDEMMMKWWWNDDDPEHPDSNPLALPPKKRRLISSHNTPPFLWKYKLIAQPRPPILLKQRKLHLGRPSFREKGPPEAKTF